MSEVRDVAQWMLQRLHENGELYQDEAVDEIERNFGSAFVYENENGNPAIDRGVLREFRRLTGESVVWERGEQLWRRRSTDDEDGRQQD